MTALSMSKRKTSKTHRKPKADEVMDNIGCALMLTMFGCALLFWLLN
jgi:hypothetical protein